MHINNFIFSLGLATFWDVIIRVSIFKSIQTLHKHNFDEL